MLSTLNLNEILKSDIFRLAVDAENQSTKLMRWKKTIFLAVTRMFSLIYVKLSRDFFLCINYLLYIIKARMGNTKKKYPVINIMLKIR